MSNPFLTIVTITKDDPVGLQRTLVSAQILREAGVEQLVINGGTDPEPTVRVVAQAGGGVSVIARPARGIADAFNAGIAAAQGEWVWFLNGGDEVDSRLTPEFLLSLLKSTRAEVVIGGTTYEGEVYPRPHPPGKLQWPPVRSWIPHPSTLVRRGLFERFGGFADSFSIAMDYEWWLRVFSSSEATVAADVTSIPFAVFYSGGISQQPGQRATIAQERDRAICQYQKLYWIAWLSDGGRLVRAWLHTRFGRHHRSLVRHD